MLWIILRTFVVISSDLPFKEGYARFTTIYPLSFYLINNLEEFVGFLTSELLNSEIFLHTVSRAEVPETPIKNDQLLTRNYWLLMHFLQGYFQMEMESHIKLRLVRFKFLKFFTHLSDSRVKNQYKRGFLLVLGLLHFIREL